MRLSVLLLLSLMPACAGIHLTSRYGAPTPKCAYVLIPTYDDLIVHLGEPARKVALERGGYVAQWDARYRHHRNCTTSYVLSAEGKVLECNERGNGCPWVKKRISGEGDEVIFGAGDLD